MNYNKIRKIINECINNFLREEHLKVVDNIKEVAAFIGDKWESYDDVWWLKIDARQKDVRNYNNRTKGEKKLWVRRYDVDGTSRDKHVGYAIVRGKSKEDCINSILNGIVLLNPWAAKEYGSRYVYSNGNAEAIKNVCNFFYARCYITINKRSMKEVLGIARGMKMSPLSNGREFHNAIGRMKRGVDINGVNWTEKRPLGLVDCDVDNVNGQRELEDYLRKNNVKIYLKRQSHDGMHYVISAEDAEKLDFGFMAKYDSNNKVGDFNTKFKHDASMLVYSAVG